MRRALPVLGLTGAGLALVLNFDTTAVDFEVVDDAEAASVTASATSPATSPAMTRPSPGTTRPSAATTAPSGGSTPGASTTVASSPSTVLERRRTREGFGSTQTTLPPTTVPGAVAGPVVGTRFGPVQVAVVMDGATIADVTVLQLPYEHPKSYSLSVRAVERLREEVLATQSPDVHNVSGATYTAKAYIVSLQGALDAARAGA